jgi:hypothetical protein
MDIYEDPFDALEALLREIPEDKAPLFFKELND